VRSLRALFAPAAVQSRPPASTREANGPSAVATASSEVPQPGLQAVIARVAALREEKRYAEAIGVINSVTVSADNRATLLLSRSAVLFAWGRLKEAHRGFAASLASAPPSPDAMLQLGWSHLNAGDVNGCEQWMRKAIASGRSSYEAHFGLAIALIEEQRFDEASAACAIALELRPDDLDSVMALGECRIQQANFIAAEKTFRRAIELAAGNAPAWVNLGIALRMQGRHDAALEAFTRAEALELADGSSGAAFMNLAMEHHIAGNLKEALAVFERRLPLSADIQAHRAYAHALLSDGRLEEGWHHYEFRWLFEPLMSMRVGPVRPMWAGQDLKGKVVMLRLEQGFGDAIQFIRYAPMLKALGARVLMRRFSAVAEAFDGIDRFFDGDDSPDFDYYIPLLSLPRLFGTDIETIPADIPYLKAATALVARWSARLDVGAGLRIGIVWAGNPVHPRDRARSMALATLAPLLDIGGVRFISLQKGAPADEANLLVQQGKLANLGPELEDFDDTAAVISSLDLIISVDTAVAHLAAALGKPVWLLVQRDADWRWMEKRNDSPWYPTMRLFRQRRDDVSGSWTNVVDRVKTALLAELQGGSLERPRRAGSGVTAATQSQTPRRTLAAELRGSVKPRGHRVGMSAVTEARVGILQYQPDERPIGDALGWYGEWLQAELEFLGRIMRPGSAVMEVGAGVGAHAIAISRLIGAEGHLYLYENRPVVWRILQQNLNANRVGNATLMVRSIGKPEASSGDAVPKTESVDDLQVEKLDWLKIGSAVAVQEILAGSTDTLWRLRPCLFIAAADDDALRELAERMKAFGYRCWKMETPLFDPRNFNRREADIFEGETALALVAVPEERDVDILLSSSVTIL
jgi:tetratricopeptide (TPR) repeat protein/precorrin-6B methylase 2